MSQRILPTLLCTAWGAGQIKVRRGDTTRGATLIGSLQLRDILQDQWTADRLLVRAWINVRQLGDALVCNRCGYKSGPGVRAEECGRCDNNSRAGGITGHIVFQLFARRSDICDLCDPFELPLSYPVNTKTHTFIQGERQKRRLSNAQVIETPARDLYINREANDISVAGKLVT
jgi:ribosomal protein L40E